MEEDMKKTLIVLTTLILLMLVACDNNTVENKTDVSGNIIYTYTTSQELEFKNAYLNSISQHTDVELSIDGIELIQYYGKVGRGDAVKMTNVYRTKPHMVHNEVIEKFHFRYDHGGNQVYLIFDDQLYTGKSAFEEDLINKEELLTLFLFNSFSINNLNYSEIQDIENRLGNESELEDGNYIFTRYYGKYNGFHAITLENINSFTVCEDEYIENLHFQYPYPGSHIRLINGQEMYTIKEAYRKGHIQLEDIYKLFEKHTNSPDVSEELVTTLLKPAFDIHKDYISDYTMDILYLDKYYGLYQDCHIFSFHSTEWLAKYYTESTNKVLDALRYGGSAYEFVLYEETLYTLKEAIDKGIIDPEIEDIIISKKYILYP